MKKTGVFLIILILASFVSADILTNPDSQVITQDNPGGVWDWILNSSIVKGINSLLTGISFIFIILMNTPYSPTFAFIFTVMFWIFFLLSSSNILKIWTKPPLNLISGLLFALIISYATVLRVLAGFFEKMLLNAEEDLTKIMIFLGVLIGLAILYFVIAILINMYFQKKKQGEETALKKDVSQLKKEKEKKVEETEDEEEEESKAFLEGFSKSTKELEAPELKEPEFLG